jgi:hypothetical protein
VRRSWRLNCGQRGKESRINMLMIRIAWFVLGFPSSARLFQTSNGLSETWSLSVPRRKPVQLVWYKSSYNIESHQSVSPPLRLKKETNAVCEALGCVLDETGWHSRCNREARLWCRWFGFRIAARTRDFSLQTPPNWVCGPPSPLFTGYPRSFPGGKLSGREVNQPHPSGAEVKYEWSCTSASPVWFHWVSRDKFTF